MLLGCVLFVFVLLLYCAWRWRRWKCAVEAYVPAMPPKRQLSWAPPRLGATDEKALAVAAGSSTAVSGGDHTFEPRLPHPSTSPNDLDPLADLKHGTIPAAANGALFGVMVADAFSRIASDVLSNRFLDCRSPESAKEDIANQAQIDGVFPVSCSEAT